MYPEKPKRGSSEPLDFVSPSPLDGCITLLKRQAYDVWGDQFRLNVDSITPDEWVIQVFYAPGGYATVKLIDGRLIADESGGTRVTIHEVQSRTSTMALYVMAAIAFLIGIFVMLFIRNAGLIVTVIPMGVAAILFIGALMNIQNPRGKRILSDIEGLLRR